MKYQMTELELSKQMLSGSQWLLAGHTSPTNTGNKVDIDAEVM